MKQFLRHIFLLLVALFMATTNAWAADCTIGETHNTVTAIADGRAFGYKPFGQINLCSTRSNLKILSISLSVKMDDEGAQGFEGIFLMFFQKCCRCLKYFREIQKVCSNIFLLFEN